MKQQFRDIHLSTANMQRLHLINAILDEYHIQGYILTLRQLYYQLVSSDVIPNKPAEYNKLSALLREGRMGGYVDWDAIEDRLRRPDRPSFWNSPSEILDGCISQYRVDRMEGQENYIEVWVEKDALSGVLKRVTGKYGIPIVVNRGYSSCTAMFDAHNRFERAYRRGQIIRILYIGDFDPSGQDMIRDITARISEFNIGKTGSNFGYEFHIESIALTMEQIQQYAPPPNPAKITDPRAADYIRRYGPTSWEVDALKPEVLNRILTSAIISNIDEQQYQRMLEIEQLDINELIKLRDQL